MKTPPAIFGIGNPIVDIIFHVSDDDIKTLGLQKGTMSLVTKKQQTELINYLQIENALIFPGGSAPNTIIACNGLGVPSVLSGKIGNDKFGEIYLEQIKKYNVLSKVVQGIGPTGTSVVLITPDAERTMNTCLSISSNFSIKNINLVDLKSSEYLYIEGYLVTSDVAMEAVHQSIEFSSKNDVKIALTFSDLAMVKYFKDNFKSILNNKVDLLFCNEDEAKTFSGYDTLEDSIKYLGKLSSTLVVTLGKNGSLIYHNGEKITIDPYPTKAVDTVGAGDTFAGAFLYGITNGFSLKKSGELASLLSSKVVSKIGPRLEKDDILSNKNFFK